MLRLLTLGGLTLESSLTASAPASTRSRLALLAIVAVAGSRGVSRDKVAMLLWADGDDEHGRSSLRQALYTLRRELGGGEVTTGNINLRLNTEYISADVSDFDGAIERDELERAVELYKGPFLEGVHLRNSVDFERWVDEHRSRLALAYSSALERLAHRASAANDYDATVNWLQKRAVVEPLSSRIAAAYMNALAQSGDREAAIRHGVLYEKMAERELGSGAGVEIKELTMRLRTASAPPSAAIVSRLAESANRVTGDRSGSAPIGWPRSAVSTEMATSMEADHARSVPKGERTDASTPVPFAHSTTSGHAFPKRTVAFAVGAMVVIAATGAAVLGLRVYTRQRDTHAKLPSPNEIVTVLPFCVDGAPKVTSLGQEIADVINSSLSSTASLVPEEASNLVENGDIGVNGCTGDQVEIAREIAAHSGAFAVVSGRISSRGAHIVLTGTLQRRAAGDWKPSVLTVEGPADSTTALATLLASETTGSLLGEDAGRISQYSKQSPSALKFYLSGQSFYRQGRNPEALTAFSKALDTDTSFALAALGIAEAGGWDWTAGLERQRRGLFTTWSLRHQLSGRDRSVFEALVGRPDRFRSSAEEYSDWQLATERAPDSPTAWYEFGDRLYHIGWLLGISNARDKARAAFERSLQVDSAFQPAVMHLLQLAIERKDWKTVDDLQPRLFTSTSEADLVPFLRWRIAAARGNERQLDSLRLAFGQATQRALIRIVGYSQIDAVDIRSGQAAADELLRQAATADEILLALLAQHDLAINRGDYAKASGLVDRIGAVGPIRPGIVDNVVDADALWITDAMIGGGDTVAAAAAAARIAHRTAKRASTGSERFREVGDLCALGLWRVRGPSVSNTIGTSARLRERLAGADSARFFGASGDLCALMIDAKAAVYAGKPDARAMVGSLDSLARVGPQEYGIGFVNVILADLWSRLGDERAALAASRRRLYDWTTGARYFIAHVRAEAELARRVGDAAGAANARKVLRVVAGP